MAAPAALPRHMGMSEEILITCMVKTYQTIRCHLQVNHVFNPVLCLFFHVPEQEAELITCSSPNRRIFKGNIALPRYSAQ